MNNMLTGQGGYGSILNNRMGGLGSLLGGTGGGNFSFGGPPQQQQQQQMGMFQQGGFGGGFNPMMGGFGGGFGQQFGGFNPMMGGGMGGFGFNPMMGGFGGGFGQQFGGFNPMMGGGMGGFGGFSGGGFGIPFGGGFNMPFGMGGFSPYGMGAFNPYAQQQQMQAMLQQRGGVPGQYDPGYMHQGPGGGREMPTNRLTDDARLIGNNPGGLPYGGQFGGGDMPAGPHGGYDLNGRLIGNNPPPGMMLNPDYRPNNRLTSDVRLSDYQYLPIQGGTIAPGRPSPPPMQEIPLMDYQPSPGNVDPRQQKLETDRAAYRDSPYVSNRIKQIREEYPDIYGSSSDDQIFNEMLTPRVKGGI